MLNSKKKALALAVLCAVSSLVLMSIAYQLLNLYYTSDIIQQFF